MTPGATASIFPGSGAASNGTFYDGSIAGAGTNYSLQSAAQATGTVTSAAGVITATTGIFTSAMVGNGISDGTKWVMITSFTSSLIVNTTDTDPAWTAASVKVGGANSTADLICTKIVAGNTIAQKNTGSDSLTTARTVTAGTITLPVYWRGYNVVLGDIDNGSVVSTHLATGFLDTTNFPVLALGNNTLTFGDATTFAGLKITSTKAGTAITCSSVANVGRFFRISLANTSTNSLAICLQANSSTICTTDCDFSNATAAGGFAFSMNATGIEMTACRITSANGGGITTNSGIVIIGCVFYSMATSQTAILQGANNRQIQCIDSTFDSILGTCLSQPNFAQTSPITLIENNVFSNCGTGCNNLRSGAQRIQILGGNNQFWSTTTPYTGWNNVTDTTGFLNGDVQTGSNSNYVSQGTNFRPSATDNGIGMGLPYGTTIGAFQRYPAIPAVGNVKSGITYGQDNTTIGTFAEFTGTFVGGGFQGISDGLRD